MGVKQITVIGSGVMGAGIAQVAAQAGFQVYMFDINDEVLAKARVRIEKNLSKGISLGKLQPEDKERVLSNLLMTTDLYKAGERADLVIEAIPEILDLKVNLFEQLDEICPAHTVLASNTSTMSITEIGASTGRSDKTIAMHFFNPPHIMKLVEVIKGLDTSYDTEKIALETAWKMGKETVIINELPGFATSRISCLVGNEAYYMLMEGLASAQDIDKAIKLGLNYPMGPLELTDLVGLDVRLRNLQYLHEHLGEKFRPCPLLVKYVKAGRLGRKSGRGFYEYSEDGVKL
jgi:3-hydroxybutyryl-CoA dehydrogenase